MDRKIVFLGPKAESAYNLQSEETPLAQKISSKVLYSFLMLALFSLFFWTARSVSAVSNLSFVSNYVCYNSRTVFKLGYKTCYDANYRFRYRVANSSDTLKGAAVYFSDSFSISRNYTYYNDYFTVPAKSYIDRYKTLRLKFCDDVVLALHPSEIEDPYYYSGMLSFWQAKIPACQ